MKRFFWISASSFLVSLFLLSRFSGVCCFAADAAKTYELNFTSEYMDKHPTVRNAFQPWMKLVEERSRGRIRITYFNPNTLAPAKDAYDSTVSGVIEIGAGYCGLNPGKFPLNEVMELPMLVPGSEAGSLVTWALYKRFPEWQREYKDVKMLWQWASATYQLHTTKKLVQTLEDLKGQKIIGWSPLLLEMVRALGANALQISPTDTYLALQRGMADGVICPLAPVRSYKISDAAKYHTIVDISVGPFWAGMNAEMWKSMPPDLQKLIEDTTGVDLARQSGMSLDQGAAEDSKWLKMQGHALYVLPDSEKAKWLEKLSYLPEGWIKKMQGKGYQNARKIFETAVQLGQEYAKTTGRGYQE